MTARLLALLQLSDSGFPSGSFAHSYGLEQALNERLISGVNEIESFVRSVVLQSAATADGRAAYAACAAARRDEIAPVVETDSALFRTKAAAELRQACVSTGRRLIEETAIHVEAPVLHTYAGRVAVGETPGCHAVSFGVVAGALGVEPEDAVAALLLGTANALLQAAMRLGRISHRDAQAILHRLRPAIASAASDSEQEILSDKPSTPHPNPLPSRGEGITSWVSGLRAFHPLQEIASMRHERAEARLFAS